MASTSSGTPAVRSAAGSQEGQPRASAWGKSRPAGGALAGPAAQASNVDSKAAAAKPSSDGTATKPESTSGSTRKPSVAAVVASGPPTSISSVVPLESKAVAAVAGSSVSQQPAQQSAWTKKPASITSAPAQASRRPAANSSRPVKELGGMLGATVRLHLSPIANLPSPDRDLAEGVVWGFDASLGFVALEIAVKTTTAAQTGTANDAKQAKTYQLVRLDRIRSYELVQPTPSDFVPMIVQRFPQKVLVNREKAAVRAETVAAARVGPKGVTPLGQAIYDALAKTLPVRWHKTNIIVMDEILISPPYNPPDCRTSADDPGANGRLLRIQKVLEGERTKVLRQQPGLSSA
ncbi:uncharacterized protein L969DRAFT_17480 [Mixia osmundae IAM 14324]|uniref:AD domain-containing protein n=1 Tax=Mixia osmundae (strain CBS 9802 / IAM 14324 / JCM 22182 / KY 12970) TaxID=764103 RepID=G7DVZ7_MIXOS|nr:uncharacterized protein L969DRAFT_17480 [Mixia osmundae IAM 14324]KEI39561.1 hypothetical protein L969DRAFT_17480 [Mixia osmundae IAM 14324]GAA94757.1 hypothetical protein E5Q_01411 [Mixia osmundae IAM 14324]